VKNSGLSRFEAWPAPGTSRTDASGIADPSFGACRRTNAGSCSPYSTSVGAVIAERSTGVSWNAATARTTLANSSVRILGPPARSCSIFA
jgi:hypothetical protein